MVTNHLQLLYLSWDLLKWQVGIPKYILEKKTEIAASMRIQFAVDKPKQRSVNAQRNIRGVLMAQRAESPI